MSDERPRNPETPNDPDATLGPPGPASGDPDATLGASVPAGSDPDVTVPAPPPSEAPSEPPPADPRTVAEDDPAYARTLLAWEQTLAANPAVVDATVTLKLPPSTSVADDPRLPTLTAETAIAFAPATSAEPADYVVGERLGAGGMGEVYQADQRVLRRRIALKLLHGKLAERPDLEEQFVAEAVITGRLEHPNIVPVYDLGRSADGRVYMGMKLVQGQAFDAVLRETPPTSPPARRAALGVLAKVCDAVAFAHSVGVLHRDLKPSNVMVGAFGEVQVMDWGLAYPLDEAAPGGEGHAGAAGTPAYMSPEQANAEADRYGPTLDVYLLGAMLYEILTGSPPHRGPSVLKVLVAATLGRIQPPRERAPERPIPRDLEALCLAALAADPADRIATAIEFKEGIERHLQHEEALAMIERARGLVEDAPPGQSPHQRADALTRARVTLEQALEIWPESTDAGALLARTRFLQADLALDRGDGRAALALAADLEEADGVDPARVVELRLAARRQRRRRLNQIVAAVTLGLAAVTGPQLWKEFVVTPREREQAREAARFDVPRATADGWDALQGGAKLTSVRDALEELETAAGRARFRQHDGPLLRCAAAWVALRRGDRAAAAEWVAGALPGTLGQRLRARLAESVGADPLAEAADWRAEVAEAKEPPSPQLQVAAETLILLAATAPRALDRSPEVARAVGARLAELGARALLVDARSGVPPVLLQTSDRTPPVRPQVVNVWRKDGRRTVGGRALIGRDGASGAELWRFPPEPLQARAADCLVAPALVRGPDGDALLVGWGCDVLVLDPRTGAIRARHRVYDRVAQLLPGDAATATLVLPADRSGMGRARSHLLPCRADGLAERTSPGADLSYLWQPSRDLGDLLEDVAGSRPDDDAERAQDELARLDALAGWDPTNPELPYARARRLLTLGRTAEAVAELERLLTEDLGPARLAGIADKLDEAPGGLAGEQVDRVVDRLIDRAIALRAAEGVNPDLSPILFANPAFAVRRIAQRAMDAGDEQRALDLLDRSRLLATTLEADQVFLTGERRWLEARGRGPRLAALAPLEARARRLGGLFMVPQALVEAFDLVLLLTALLPSLIAVAWAFLWARTHQAQRANLRELGFRTWGARLLAFVTHPWLRVTHTVLAYATRTERLAIVACTLLPLLGAVYLTLVVSTIGRVAGVPITLGGGSFAHPTTREYVLAAMDGLPPAETAPHLRLLAEGALQREAWDEAARLLTRITALAPDDPFALTNLGLLDERRGDRDRALERYARASAAPGEAGAVARFNAARLRGEALPSLPVPYRALARSGPPARPVRQFAAQDDLLAVLGVSASPLALYWKALTSIDGTDDLRSLLGFGAALSGGSTPGFVTLLDNVVLPLAILIGLLALLHLPFPSRSRAAPERAGPAGRLARVRPAASYAANALLPGSLWLIRGRIALGVLAMTAAPVLWLVARIGTQGGILVSLAMPNLPLLFSSGEREVIVSPTFQALAPLAQAGLWGIYLAAWGHAAWALVGWLKRRRAAEAPPPADATPPV